MKGSSLVLLSMLCASLCSSSALAEPPANALQEAASALVHKQVVQPLKKADAKHKRFSRDPAPPKARRVRVLDDVAQTDVRGKQFMRFAIDLLYRWAEEGEWNEDVFVGCVYVNDRAVFLQQGSDYLPASSALTGDGEAQPDVCRPAPQAAAPVAAPAG